MQNKKGSRISLIDCEYLTYFFHKINIMQLFSAVATMFLKKFKKKNADENMKKTP